MQTPTTIAEIFRKGTVYVPSYQRAYSWDTEKEGSKSKQVNTFLDDLEDYIKNNPKLVYYFGHFLFEEKTDSTFGIIDGQQRLTTIVIFMSTLFNRLKEIRPLKKKNRKFMKSS